MEYKSRELERKFQNQKSDGNINYRFPSLLYFIQPLI